MTTPTVTETSRNGNHIGNTSGRQVGDTVRPPSIAIIAPDVNPTAGESRKTAV
jgi:hypothetical protein